MSKRSVLLLLASNDIDTVDPRAANEISGINEAIQPATHRRSIKRYLHPGLTVSDIRTLSLRYKPNLLHLSGHARANEGLVIEENGQVALLGCADLVKLILSSTDDALRLVFFSFCHSEACAAAIAKKRPYAIGVRGEIAAASLLLFCRAFYEALASDLSVRGAFDNARELLKRSGLDGAEAMVLKGGRRARAKLPFLSGDAPAHAASGIASDLSDLTTKFVSQLRIAGYVRDETDVRRAVYLDEGLYVHRKRAETAVAEFIAKAASNRSRGGKWLDIVGDAGHGKSSLLWYLFTEWQANPGFTVVPFLAQTETDLAVAVTTAARVLEHRRKSQLLVLIDTLDLIVGIDDRQVAKAIGELTALGAVVVTTSRRQEADQLGRLLSSDSRVELRRFDDGEAQQAIRYQIQIRYPQASEPKRAEQFEKIWGLLEQQRDVRELDLEPLILRMLFESYGSQDIPREVNTQQIYEQYWHEVVLFDRMAKTADDRLAREQLCRYVARRVAFGTTHTDKILTSALTEPNAGLRSPTQTLEGLVSSGVLQWAEGRSSVRFFHQTFLEFTAAYDLLSLDRSTLDQFVTQLLEDVTGFNFFRAPILKQLAIQCFEPDPDLHRQLLKGLRDVNNELAAQLTLEILGKVPGLDSTTGLVSEWIAAEPQTFVGVVCETVRHYPQRKTGLALELLEPFIGSNKETAIFAICADTFSPGEPEVVQQFLHRQLPRVMKANDDIKTYFEHALFAAARNGAVNAIHDLLALLPVVKPGQQAAILEGIALSLNAKTSPLGERVVMEVIDLLPQIPGKQRNEVWDALCRFTRELNRISPEIGSRIAARLVADDIWRRDTGSAQYVGKIAGHIQANATMTEQAIDNLCSRDHFIRMFNTGFLKNAPAELSPLIMSLIEKADHRSFSDIDTVRALFTVVSSLADISADRILAFLERWTWPPTGIGTALNLIVEQLAAADPQTARDWMLAQLKKTHLPNIKVVRALALLIQKTPEVFDSAQLREVYENSFTSVEGRQIIASAVGAIAAVDRELAEAMFQRLFIEEGKVCQITAVNSLEFSLESDPEFVLQFGPQIIDIFLQQHLKGLLDNYLVLLKKIPLSHAALLLSRLDQWFTEAITQQLDEKITSELLALLRIATEADPDLTFRISQRIPISSKGIAGGLAALYDNISEHSEDPDVLGGLLSAVAKISTYDQVRIGNALSRTLPRLARKIGRTRVIEMVMSVYRTIENEKALSALVKAALKVPGWGPEEDAALLADKNLPRAVRSILSNRARR